ncbi:uncharacterized protein METZ01_LOCUS211896, partial [marine metagenome]
IPGNRCRTSLRMSISDLVGARNL